MLEPNVLKNWRSFQFHKFKERMELNMFPCNFSCGNLSGFQSTLSFISVPAPGESRLELRCQQFCINVPIATIAGYTPELLNIQIPLLPEGEPPVLLILEFQTEAIHTVVLGRLQDFLRDPVNEPTPPSVSESDGN